MAALSDNDEEEFLSNRSKHLTLVLNSEGFFTRMEIERVRTPLFEMLMHDLHHSDVVLTGSSIDGSALLDSDIDRMHPIQDMAAVFDEKEEKDSQKYTFLVDARQNQSCFVKLALIAYPRTSGLPDNVIEKDGVYFLSSEKYRNFKIIPASVKWLSNSDVNEHGPCALSSIKFGIPCQSIDLDITEGIKCSKWPSVALGWISRDRKGKWPPRHLIKQARNFHVHVVPVGDPNSEDCSLGWRLSFTFIERELVWSFNDTQLNSFVLLKAIFKTFLEPIANEQLSTYHLKTILFWVSEESSIKLQPFNLIRLLNLCLQMLKECISRKTLKHFIISNHNLFHNKFENIDIREGLINKIDYILSNIFPVLQQVLSNLLMEDINFISFERCANMSEGNYSSLTQFSQVCVALSEGAEKNIRNKKRFRRNGAIYLLMITMVKKPVEFLDLLELLNTFDRVVDEYNKEIVITLKRFLLIRLGILFHYYYINRMEHNILPDFTDDSIYEETFEDAKGCFKKGRFFDGLSGYLYQALFLLVQGDLEQMFEEMEEIFKKSVILVYEGLCINTTYVQISYGEISLIKDYQEIYDDDRPSPVCYDVFFTGDDVRYVPKVLQFECILNVDDEKDSFYLVYHPAVFAYFLLFQLHQRLNNNDEKLKALSHLEKITEKVKDGNDGHRALNLLGYCFNEVGDEEKAFLTFRLSLQMKNSDYNAAVYHLCLMIMKHLPETYLYQRNV